MKKPTDYTYLAVRRQLDAMRCTTYEVGAYDRDSDRMQMRIWDRDQVLKSLAWLKARNVAGNDVFVRPYGNSGLVFFDDLSRGVIARMIDEGLQPAVVIESSPANFHGWVRVADDALDTSLATACAKVLAQRYDGDVDSADWRHFGRLAGFTNQKPKYRDEQGRAPYVRLDSVKQGIASGAAELLAEGCTYLQHREAERKARAVRLQGILPASSLKDASEFFLRELAGLIDRYGGGMDRSRADWMIAIKMASLGYSADHIKAVLHKHSLAAANRPGHSTDYVERTVANVFGMAGQEPLAERMGSCLWLGLLLCDYQLPLLGVVITRA